MSFSAVLIANRGEVSIRIARALSELGLRGVAAFSEDDAKALHVRSAHAATRIPGVGVSAYLDIESLVAAAREAGCDAIHPGYGFLSESAAFAQACESAGIVFIGPNIEALQLLGNKGAARSLARECGVPLFPGTESDTSVLEAVQFLKSLGQGGAMMIKATAGGGGRGLRVVTDVAQVEDAYHRCRSEARAAFGIDTVYVEQFVPRARHIEIQVIGDGDDVAHLWERECTLQRQHQKLIEIAPSPNLAASVREALAASALQLARRVKYDSIGTFEFLLDADNPERFAFMEANPRLQVEHTVTEEVLSVDLVKAQVQIAAGETLKSLGLTQKRIPAPRGFAIQARINMETMTREAGSRPTGGVLCVYEMPSGPGVRVDGYGYSGYKTNPAFDSLLSKVIAFAPGKQFGDALARARRALNECRVSGVETNIPFLRALLARPEVSANETHTRFVAENIDSLLDAASHAFDVHVSGEAPAPELKNGATEDLDDFAVVRAPMQGQVLSISVQEGDLVRADQEVAVMNSMKMEHLILAQCSGIVRRVLVAAEAIVFENEPLLLLEEVESEGLAAAASAEADLNAIRPDLARLYEKLALGADENRKKAVQKRRGANKRTARENVADLFDADSFIEYGALVVAARRQQPFDELMSISPGDGLIAGIGTVNAAIVGEERGRAMAMSYDYTVFAGTQGVAGHKKTDRVFEVASRARLPFVLLAEGGGGRLGDSTSYLGASGTDIPTFARFGALNGVSPIIGMTSGFCFAGNAALLGCCDVVIATRDSNIGMGGPSMIEAGGLGAYRPEDIGPAEVQYRNGVIDILVDDERAAIAEAKKYLLYFQGNLDFWEAADQRRLRNVVPENRVRAYDIRPAIEGLCDVGSILELRKGFGQGMISCLGRIEGRPVGIVANNPRHLGGAIDPDGADKYARFLQLCDTFGLPIISLVDTPGFMVGPEVETRAQVRHAGRMFVVASGLRVPFLAVVLRKGYGLGAMAMTAGCLHSAFFSVAWPTGEFGGANLEGTVRVALKPQLEAIVDEVEREAFFKKVVAQAYDHGKAINVASYHELDAVIDPADTRRWILRALTAYPKESEHVRRRGFIDTW